MKRAAMSVLLLLPLALPHDSHGRQQGEPGDGQAPQTYAPVYESSRLALRTHRSGLLGFLGHEHGVLATSWDASLCIDPDRIAGSSVVITIPVDSLKIDTPRARELAGLDPDEGPGDEDVAEIQSKMLGPGTLHAEAYPTITFRSDAVRSADGEGDIIVEGELTLHGRTADVELPMHVEQLGGDTLRMSGETEIRHTTFGMEPESVAMVVNVANEMDLMVRVTAVPTGRPCDANG